MALLSLRNKLYATSKDDEIVCFNTYMVLITETLITELDLLREEPLQEAPT